jgi:hypothetical protein
MIKKKKNKNQKRKIDKSILLQVINVLLIKFK